MSNQSKADLCLNNKNYNKNEYRYGNGKGCIVNFLTLSEKRSISTKSIPAQILKFGLNSFLRKMSKDLSMESP